MLVLASCDMLIAVNSKTVSSLERKNGRDLLEINSQPGEQCVCVATLFLDQSQVHVNTQATISSFTLVHGAVCELQDNVNCQRVTPGFSYDQNTACLNTSITLYDQFQLVHFVDQGSCVGETIRRDGLCGFLLNLSNNRGRQPCFCFRSILHFRRLLAPTTIHRTPVGFTVAFGMLQKPLDSFVIVSLIL